MLEREKLRRDAVELNTDLLVPGNHLLRKIDSAVDFSHIYDFLENLYCEDNGRPSVDPVVLFKIVLIRHLYGIPSLRRTMQEINMSIPLGRLKFIEQMGIGRCFYNPYRFCQAFVSLFPVTPFPMEHVKRLQKLKEIYLYRVYFRP